MPRRLRSPVVWGVAAALLLGLPLVPSYRFIGSDFLQLAVAARAVELPGIWPFNLYAFSDGSPAFNAGQMARGGFQWFFDPAWKVRFFRPLSSLLMVVNHELAGRRPLAYGAHALAWYVLLVALLGAVARRVFRRPGQETSAAAYLAVLLFAMAARNMGPLLYGAGRWVLIAAALGLGAVWAHLRWRQDGWAPGHWISLVALILSFLAGESALAFAAMIVTYELCAAPGSRRERVRAGLPVVLATIAYLGFYLAGGYGTAGQDGYLSPAGDLSAFLAAAPLRSAYLVGEMTVGLSSLLAVDPFQGSPARLGWVLAVELGFWVLLLAPLYRDAPLPERRTMRWLVLGTAAALVPALSAQPGVRLAIVPSLGGALLMAMALTGWWRRWRVRRTAVAWAGGLACLALASPHLVYSPWHWLGSLGPIRDYAELLDAGGGQRGLEGIGVEDTVVFLDGASFPDLLFTYDERRAFGQPVPVAWRELSTCLGEHRYSRPDERTLELELPGGGMFDAEYVYAYRTRRRPLLAGDAVELPGLRVEVLATGAAGPTRLRYRFAHPLEDPRYRFFRTSEEGFAAVAPPPVGGTLTIP